MRKTLEHHSPRKYTVFSLVATSFLWQLLLTPLIGRTGNTTEIVPNELLALPISRTMGESGRTQVPGGSEQTVFASDNGKALCTTAELEGPGKGHLILRGGEGGSQSVSSSSVQAGGTAVVCGSTIKTVVLRCAAGPECQFIWHVDERD